MRCRSSLVLVSMLLASTQAWAGGACTEGKDGRTVCKDGSNTVVIRPDGGLDLDGQPFSLVRTPNGMAGKVGGEKLSIYRDGNIMVGRIGDKRLVCYTEPSMGITICK